MVDQEENLKNSSHSICNNQPVLLLASHCQILYQLLNYTKCRDLVKDLALLDNVAIKDDHQNKTIDELYWSIMAVIGIYVLITLAWIW